MPISVASPARRHARLAAPLRAIVRAALAVVKRRAGEIAILLTDDTSVRTLNRRWRGIDRATDVLSFAYTERRDGRIDGDIAISLDRMSEQAKRFRVTRGRELARLVVHGALHLAGLDHARPAERLQMRRCEAHALRACTAQVRALDRAFGFPARRRLPGAITAR